MPNTFEETYVANYLPTATLKSRRPVVLSSCSVVPPFCFMPALRVKKTKSKKSLSYARLTPAVRNRIIGMKLVGAGRQQILGKTHKKDGASPSLKAVDDILAHFAEDPEWDGGDSCAGGRPRLITPQQEKSIEKILERDVGKFVVTARYVKKKLPALRKVREEVVQNTFSRLGYAYRDRRRKAAIGDEYKPARLVYCDWLLKQAQSYLNKFAYTDGTTFFLANDESQNTGKQRAALGRKIWRRKDGSDSLEDKNVGPSVYAKAQGKPVKIWGVWGDGHLEYFLLPEVTNEKGRKRSANMNGDRYECMVKKHFASWKKKMFPRMGKIKISLVKDFEGFLRQPRNLKAEEDAGFKTLKQHTKCSPDLNAIENAWDLLQDRLLLTAPVDMEPRCDFVKRLRRTVNWMNTNARKQGRDLCRNQKKRAAQVKKLKGARCSY